MTMIPRRIVSSSPEQTRQIGESLAAIIRPGDVVCLKGGLGVGKTSLVQGICAALGVKEDVVSPSFSLINEYRGSIVVYHIDLYRLEGSWETEYLGLEEFLYGEGVSFIEWPARAEKLLPFERLDIEIERTGDNSRIMHLIPSGETWDERIGD